MPDDRQQKMCEENMEREHVVQCQLDESITQLHPKHEVKKREGLISLRVVYLWLVWNSEEEG